MVRSAPADYAAFREALDAHRDSLPKRLRQCAAFFDEYPERVAFDTVAQVADAAQVQPSAVMRFAKVLGFSGYSELQGIFRSRYADRWPDYPTRLARLRAESNDTPHDLLEKFSKAGQRSMARLAEDIVPDVLNKATEALSKARLIHIAGFRRSFPVAAYLAYAFDKQERSCRLIDGTGLLGEGSAFEPGQALIAVSVAPYTQQTVELVKRAHKGGAVVIAISDSPDSPIFSVADHRLEVREEDVGDFRTLAATFALATALTVAVGSMAEQKYIANHKME